MKKQKLVQQNEGKNKALRSLFGIITILSIFSFALIGYPSKNEGTINEKNIRGRHLQNIVREFATTQQFCDDFKNKTGVALKVTEVDYQMNEHNFKNFDKQYAYRICKEYWR